MSQAHALAARSDGMDADLKPLYASLAASLKAAPAIAEPYRHWLPGDILPEAVARDLHALPFRAPDLHGVSGKRELHNDSRQYFDAANNARFSACGLLARLFQHPATVRLLQDATGADLSGTNVRIEYAMDSDCFLPDDPDQEDLGTDIYADEHTWAARAPFKWNTALVFVPGDNTFHGFERRDIPRVRRSVIINYVTQDWRAREQLAYPDTPVSAA
jgi:hypothetical protein